MKKIFLILGLFVLLFFIVIQIDTVDSATTNCVDSNNGRSISYIYLGQNKSASDSCLDNTWLVEYYCQSGGAFAVTKSCVNGCYDGTCRISATETCTDPDGKDYYKKETTSNSNGLSSTDVCEGGYYLWEYYCNGTTIDREYKYCDFGCNGDGACRKKTCTDSDDGRIYTKKGTTVFTSEYGEITTKVDSCTSGYYLSEYYCDSNNSWAVESKTCELGCKDDSSCRSTALSCIDSDGKNYFTKGFVTDQDGIKSNDTCETSGYNIGKLKEYHCTGNYIDFEYYSCPAGCENGVCKTLTCSDSEIGRKYNEQGTITAGLLNIVDVCMGDQLTEYFCEGSAVKSEIITCGGGCQSGLGACKLFCSDSDNGRDYVNNGLTIDLVGSMKDSCSSNKLTEYYCDGDIKKSEDIICENGCDLVLGSCKPKYTESGDNGKDYFVTGKVTDNKNNYVYNDFCGPNAKIVEYYVEDNSVKNVERYCIEGCSVGKCVVGGTCTDPDSGRNYFQRGTIIGYNGMGYADTCSSNKLTEYYCDGNTIAEETITCEYGCDVTKNGACKTASGTGTSTCTPNWQPSAWSVCINGTQTRTFSDSNFCSGISQKAPETRSCSVATVLPTVDVKINNLDGPITLAAGSTATLSWSSQNATSCGGSPSALVGNQTITVSLGQRAITARCANSFGNTTDTITLIGIESNENNNPTTNTPGICTDSDYGINYYSKGIVIDSEGKQNTDVCENNRLIEYYCLENQNIVQFEIKTCVCKDNGSCVQNNQCEDPDGKDYFSKGAIYWSGNMAFDSCQGDYLTELYCSPSGVDSSEVKKCDFGCEAGACKKGINFTSPVVSDNFQIELKKEHQIIWQQQGYNAKNVSVDIYSFEVINNQLANPVKIKNIKTIYSMQASNSFLWTAIDLPVTDNKHLYAFGVSELGNSSVSGIYGYSKPFQVVNQGSGGGGVVLNTCTDSDGGGARQYYSFGTAKDSHGIVGNDFCAGTYLGEYYCDPTYKIVSFISYPCFDGCDINRRACK